MPNVTPPSDEPTAAKIAAYRRLRLSSWNGS